MCWRRSWIKRDVKVHCYSPWKGALCGLKMLRSCQFVFAWCELHWVVLRQAIMELYIAKGNGFSLQHFSSEFSRTLVRWSQKSFHGSALAEGTGQCCKRRLHLEQRSGGLSQKEGLEHQTASAMVRQTSGWFVVSTQFFNLQERQQTNDCDIRQSVGPADGGSSKPDRNEHEDSGCERPHKSQAVLQRCRYWLHKSHPALKSQWWQMIVQGVKREFMPALGVRY